MSDPIRVLVADDQVVFRQMIVDTLGEEDDIDVVGEAVDGVEAVTRCRELRPDIILLDINMPRMDGVEATRRIVAEMPEVKVVILTAFDDEQFILRLVQVGATGYILKDSHSSEVVRALRVAHSGETLYDTRVVSKIVSEMQRMLNRELGSRPTSETRSSMEQLTERELEVLTQIGKGLKNKEICQELSISEPTVKTHVNNIMQKMGFRDRVEAVLFAVQAGLA